MKNAMITRESPGFSLVEILLAAGMMAVAGLALLGALSTGSRTAAAGGDHQLAALLAERSVDRLLCRGFAGLRASRGKAEPLDLSAMDASVRWASTGAPDPGTGGAGTVGPELCLDGVVFTGETHIEEGTPGLVRLEVTIRWRYVASPKAPAAKAVPGMPESSARLTVVRYVGNPEVSSDDEEGHS